MNIKTNINNTPSFKGGGAFAPSVRKLVKPVEISSSTVSSVLQKINGYVSSPEQRLIMGVTALFTQPFIDLNNKRVNEDTRLMSFARTISKIIVGTTVGVFVRKECIRLAHKYTKMVSIPNIKSRGFWGKPAPQNSWLSPAYVRTYNEDFHRNYVNALGTTMGIGVSMFTNFLIDAPLTQLFTNKGYKYLKEDPEEQQVKHSSNLLEKTLEEQKKVSFAGGGIEKLVEGLEHKPRGIFNAMKLWLWKKTAPNPSEMLMHTGAIGWAASSAAQISGIAVNDKINSDQKKFLIPQEFADAVANIGLYYIVTLSIKRSVEKMFENGYVRITSVMEQIQKDIRKGRLHGINTVDDVFKQHRPVKDILGKTDAGKLFSAHKNGASILATLVASVISCNILTPYFRNYYGALCMEWAKNRSAKVNAMLFDIVQKPGKMGVERLSKSSAFDKFIV